MSRTPEARIRVECQAALPLEFVGTRAAWLPCGEEPDPGLPDPNQECARAGGKRDRGVAGARFRLQNDGAKPANRNDRSNAVGVNQNEGAVDNVQLAAVDKYDRGALFRLE